MDTSTVSRSSLSMNSSLKRMEIEDEPPFADENDDAEYGEHHQLFGGSEDGDAMDEHTSSGLDLVQSEWCCSRCLPRSNLGRLLVFVSVACNVCLIVLLSAQTTSRPNGGASRTAPCAVLLSTFPNSGTTWTQAMFKASTGVVSLAVYPEGPPTPFSTHTFAHGTVGGEYRLPDPDRGECLFVKSHARVPAKVLADGSPDQLYQRAVVLYRDAEDNLHANLRYLTKLPNDNTGKKELLELCSYDPSGRPLPPDTRFEDWDSRNRTDYASLIDLHRLAHRRFYYHAERYPLPKIIITYARLLSEPFETFRDIMMFSGYADADIDRALQENPPRSHEVHGGLDYVPAPSSGITEDKLNQQFRVLWKGASPCVKRAAKILQFTS